MLTCPCMVTTIFQATRTKMENHAQEHGIHWDNAGLMTGRVIFMIKSLSKWIRDSKNIDIELLMFAQIQRRSWISSMLELLIQCWRLMLLRKFSNSFIIKISTKFYSLWTDTTLGWTQQDIEVSDIKMTVSWKELFHHMIFPSLGFSESLMATWFVKVWSIYQQLTIEPIIISWHQIWLTGSKVINIKFLTWHLMSSETC